jgi:Flp pilus assembly protein TadB
MTYVWLPIVGGGCVVTAGYVLHKWNARCRALDRFFVDAEPASAARLAAPPLRAGLRRYVRRWRWLPWLAGALVAMVALLFTPLTAPLATAMGLIVALVGSQLEASWQARRALRLEMQLADAIDLMVGALGAGAGVTAGIEAAVRETKRPLQPLLTDVLGRIRFGDDPPAVFSALAARVPLETFLLFSTALAVHWEVGGSLAPTLASLGRTVRDRIELSRKIRSNTVQAQLSVLTVLGVTYFIAAVVWRTNPEQMVAFLRSSIAQWFVAGSMILQAIGIAWMGQISRMRF